MARERTLGEALDEALDEILEEAEEPDCDEGPRAWERIYGFSNPDGTVTACVSTNDNLDTGYPSEFAEWTTRIKSVEEFHRRYGKSRTGCSGVEVEVFLDGKQL